MNEILANAREKRIAIGAFNIVNYLTAKAAINAAEELNVPLILQTSVKTVKQIGINEMISFLKDMANNAKVDVSIHLDHCTDVDFAIKCIKAGWLSIMYDGSKLSLEENIKNTKKVVSVAHEYKASVEGELGAIVGVEDDIESEKTLLANPKECKIYLEETKIDAFAPAIGTAHGVYKGEINLDYDLFKEINEFSPVPLVLHGGTGLSDEMFERLISLGSSKINISTAIKIAYCQGMREFMDEFPSKNDPLKLDEYVFNKVKDVVSSHIKQFSLR